MSQDFAKIENPENARKVRIALKLGIAANVDLSGGEFPPTPQPDQGIQIRVSVAGTVDGTLYPVGTVFVGDGTDWIPLAPIGEEGGSDTAARVVADQEARLDLTLDEALAATVVESDSGRAFALLLSATDPSDADNWIQVGEQVIPSDTPPEDDRENIEISGLNYYTLGATLPLTQKYSVIFGTQFWVDAANLDVPSPYSVFQGFALYKAGTKFNLTHFVGGQPRFTWESQTPANPTNPWDVITWAEVGEVTTGDVPTGIDNTAVAGTPGYINQEISTGNFFDPAAQVRKFRCIRTDSVVWEEIPTETSLDTVPTVLSGASDPISLDDTRATIRSVASVVEDYIGIVFVKGIKVQGEDVYYDQDSDIQLTPTSITGSGALFRQVNMGSDYEWQLLTSSDWSSLSPDIVIRAVTQQANPDTWPSPVQVTDTHWNDGFGDPVEDMVTVESYTLGITRGKPGQLFLNTSSGVPFMYTNSDGWQKMVIEKDLGTGAGQVPVLDEDGKLSASTMPSPLATIGLLPGGGTYTLLASDNGKVLEAGAAVTVEVPSGLPTGFNVAVIRTGAGAVTFTTDGVTIHSLGGALSISDQYGAASLVNLGFETYNLSGSLA